MKTESKKFLTNDTTAGSWISGRIYCTVETESDGYMVSGQPEDGFKTIKAATAFLKSFHVPSWAISTSIATGNGTIKKWMNRGYIA